LKVCFSIDADGILNVSAEEESSGNKKDITITNEKGRLSSEEIERMTKEAEHFKSEDMKHVKKVRAMNALDDYLYYMKKVMKDKSVGSMLNLVDIMMISSAMIKGKELIDGKEKNDTFVFEDYLREIKSTFESALNKS
jgi:L1 cell adhesion molecule like protein